MGRGREAADQLKQQADQRRTELNQQMDRGVLTQQNRQGNWDALCAAIIADVEEFVEHFPQAKSQNLRADKLNDNNLTVSTQVQPILKLEVLRDVGKAGVHADITKQKPSGEITQSQTPAYHFTPSGFSDGQHSYSPQELAGGFFDIIQKFFG